MVDQPTKHFCTMTLEEHKKLVPLANIQSANLHMTDSKYGSGVFTITKTEYPNMPARYGYKIQPENFDKKRWISPGGYFLSKKDCIRHAKTEHNLIIKIKE